jgi:hypothetical protein
MEQKWARRLCVAIVVCEALFLVIMAWAVFLVLDIYGLRGGDVGNAERFAWSSPFWGSAILFAVAAYLLLVQAESDSFKKVIARWALLSVVALENLIMLVAALNQAADRQSIGFNFTMATVCGIALLLIVASQASALSALGRGRARHQAP